MAAELVLTPEQLEDYLHGVERALDDIPLDGFFERALMAMRAASLNCFHNGVDPDGNPWTKVKFRLRDSGGEKQPLRDTDHLMASLTSDEQGSIVERGQNYLRYGTNLVYAAVHQYGAQIFAKQANFLCIPATMEAARAGSPRNFPRPLKPIINRLRTGGVLIEEKHEPEPVEVDEHGKPVRKPKQHQPKEDDIVHFYMTVAVTIPARPFLGWSQASAEKMVLILDDWLLGQGGHVSVPFLKAA